MSAPPGTPLFGRTQERQRIATALARGKRRIIIIGEAGVGKSALALDALETLKARHALIGTGKYGSGESGAGPLLRAMRQLVDEALEELYEPGAGLEQLRASMGPVRPLFDQVLLNRAAPSRGVGDADAMVEQLALVLDRTITWLAGFGLPLALMIDDWDRASPEVSALFLRLGALAQAGSLCLIATGRRWPEGFPEDAPDQATLTLKGLSAADRLELLTQRLGREDARAVDQLLPEATTSPLTLIRRAEAVAAQRAQGRTITDPRTVAAALQDDLTRDMDAHVQRLDEDARTAVLLAATIGDATSRAMLHRASGLEDAAFATALDRLFAARLLMPAGPLVRFPHDTIRSAILDGAAASGFDRLAQDAAARLRTAEDQQGGAQAGLEALLLAYPPCDADVVWVKPLLVGVDRALHSLDTAQASRLTRLALRMDGGLTVAAAETIRLCAVTGMTEGDVAFAADCATQLRALAQSRRDISFAYALSANAARAQGDKENAIRFSVEGHRLLGWSLSEAPSAFSTMRDIIWVNLAGQVARALPFQAETPDRDILDLSATTATIFFEYGAPHVVSVARRFALSRATRHTSAGLSAAVFMANFMGRHRLASRIGKAVIEERHRDEPSWSTSAYRGHFFGRLWTNPARSFEGVHDDLFARALAGGDLLVAAWILRNKAHLHWRVGGGLAAFAQLAETARSFAERVGNQTSAHAAAQMGEAARLLQGLEPDPAIIIDPSCPHTLETPLITWLGFHNFRGEFAETLAILEPLPRKLSISLAAHPGAREVRFHRAVAMLAGQGRYWPEDIKALAVAAKLCPGDNAARILILNALVARQRGKAEQAFRLMAEAVRTARALDRLHEVSLASYFAADLARQCGKPAEEAAYLEQARRAWTLWGASPQSHVRLRTQADPIATGDVADLERRLEQSERENRAKSRLLALVGHELRTPLQAISGAVELIHAETGRSTDLSIVTASIDRLGAMIDDLSAVTALEAGELAVHPRAFSLAVLLRTIKDTHDAPLRAAGMTLHVDAPDLSALWLFGDDKRLQQILDNLLNNARKYGAGAARLTVTHANDLWSFTVSDQGPGLSPDQAVRIFEPFVRGAATGVTPGHGIGLWLARKLAETLEGTLELAAPASGETGGRFQLIIPLAPAIQSESADEERTDGPHHILLVEDEPLSRDVLARMFALDGHQVRAFDTGLSALDAAPFADGPQIAFIDYNLPDLTGLEVARGLREHHAPGDLMIVLMSANITDDHVRAQQSGLVDRIVQKPLTVPLIRTMAGRGTALIPAVPAPQIDETARAYFDRYCQAITASFDAQDWLDLEAQAHKLAGAALTCQLPDLGAAARDLEAYAHAARAADCRAAIARISDLYAAAVQGNG